jgi:hypothetical protein
MSEAVHKGLELDFDMELTGWLSSRSRRLEAALALSVAVLLRISLRRVNPLLKHL